jgi:hypothetical protein
MSIFLFRNGDNLVEYCATDTRSGHRLPALATHWLYHAELQNALHAAVFGVMDFEATKQAISRQGYMRYTADRVLKNCN